MNCIPVSVSILCLLLCCLCGCSRNNPQRELAKESIESKESDSFNDIDGTPRYIAITIDDLPGISLENYQEVTNNLLTTLKKFKVPAIGFVNEGKLYRKNKLDQGKLGLLEDWLEAGMELGNHTFSHPDYNNLTFEEFRTNLLQGEKHTKRLQSDHGQSMQYFRHPYLHVGNTVDKKDQLEEFLVNQGYVSAPVTIDNSEWIFAKAYHLSLKENNQDQMKKVGSSYVHYMRNMTEYFERQSEELFDRPIKHTLLIHANALNGDYLDELLEMYEQEGYGFVSLNEALSDTAYNSRDEYVGKRGISWLHRWAITRQVDDSFFEGEPTCPEFVEAIAGIRD